MHSFKRDLTKMPLAAIMAAYAVDRTGDEIKDHVLRHKRTVTAAGGLTQLVFFQESVGNNNVSLQTTNMEENGKMGAGKHFLVEAIEIRPFAKEAVEADRLADLVELLNTGVLLLNYRNKPAFEDGPLINFVADTKLVGVDATTGEGGKHFYDLRNPIPLESGINFNVTLAWPDGSPALNDDVELDIRLIGQQIAAGRR